MAAHPGPVYMRLLRGNVPRVLDAFDYRFEIGRAALLRDGADVLIAATGHTRERDRRRAAEVGFDHYLVKPFDPARIDEFLAARRGAEPIPA